MILEGKIIFDPKDLTTKHKKQSSWKKVAIVKLESEVGGMWRWYINKRFNLELNAPLRGDHITFINDQYDNRKLWTKYKRSLHNKPLKVDILNKLRSNGEHWWLKIGDNLDFMDIRGHLGLSSEPYFDYHLTVGYANERNLKHSQYINELLRWNRVKL